MRRGLETPPRTIMEVYQMLPEGTLAELINGNLYMSPAPTKQHQQVLRNIFVRLHSLVTKKELGEAYFAPLDVFFDENENAVQPDIIFIANSNLAILEGADAIHGVPDLLIEVLSKGNASHDQSLKKALYEKFGVKEYWIVDPVTKEAIGFTLKNQIYNECGRYTGRIMSPSLNLAFDF